MTSASTNGLEGFPLHTAAAVYTGIACAACIAATTDISDNGGPISISTPATSAMGASIAAATTDIVGGIAAAIAAGPTGATGGIATVALTIANAAAGITIALITYTTAANGITNVIPDLTFSGSGGTG